MTRLNAKTLTSMMILSVAALALLPGAEVEAAVTRVDEPACAGFNGQALGLCVEGCRMTEEGSVLSPQFDKLTEDFQKEVGVPFQCEEPQLGSVCFAAAENLCAAVLADTVDGFRRVSTKRHSQSSHCGMKIHSQCEEQKWVGKDGTVLIHTACNDGLERCERQSGRKSARASMCHGTETAKVATARGGVCNTSRLKR